MNPDNWEEAELCWAVCLALEMAGERGGWDWDGEAAPKSEEAAEGSAFAVSAQCGGFVGWEVLNTAGAGTAQGLTAGMNRGGRRNSNQHGCRGWEQLPDRAPVFI